MMKFYLLQYDLNMLIKLEVFAFIQGILGCFNEEI